MRGDSSPSGIILCLNHQAHGNWIPVSVPSSIWTEDFFFGPVPANVVIVAARADTVGHEGGWC